MIGQVTCCAEALSIQDALSLLFIDVVFANPQGMQSELGRWGLRHMLLPRGPFEDNQLARHPKSGGVSTQKSGVIPATRVYAASVLSGELAVSGESLN